MKKFVKTILASAISATLLTGCVSDDKDDTVIGQDGTTGSGGASGQIGGDTGSAGPGGQIGGDTGSAGPGGQIGGDTGSAGPSGQIGGDAGSAGPGGQIGGDTGSAGPGGQIGGDTGSAGPSGQIGGDTGSAGPGGQIGGDTGSAGPGGQIGGDTGNVGPDGQVGGETGGEGQKGSIKGDTGQAGPSGQIGGDTGHAGPDGQVGGDTGSAGPGGQVGGNTGNAGPDGQIGGKTGGEGSKGSIAGDTGQAGPGGQIGGDTGHAGPDGQVGGDTGSAGPGGQVGGNTGNAGPDGQVGGETGGEGPKGSIPGDTGDTGNQGKAVARIYGQDASYKFHMQATNRNGVTSDIPADLTLSRGNITTSPAWQGTPDESATAINFTSRLINDIKSSGTLFMNSVNGSPIDLSVPAANGVLQFDLKVNSKPDKESEVFIEMTDDKEEKVVINISRAINAFTGASKQTVRVPLSCFENQDFNFDSTLKPFSLHTTDAINFDVDNIRFVSGIAGDRYDLTCEQADTSPIKNNTRSRIYENGNGWGRTYNAWGEPGKISTEDDRYNGAITTIFDHDYSRVRGGLIFHVVESQPNKDWSQFVENGVLRFQLRVDDYNLHPGRQLRVSFETPGNNSHQIKLDRGCSDQKWGWVEVPVKDLITDANGKVDTTIIQNIRSPLNLAPVDVNTEKGETLGGMTYSVANVWLQPHPVGEVKNGYCSIKDEINQ